MAKAKVEKTRIEKERIYIIPIREKIRVVPRYKKTNKAIKTIKEFLARHMKIRDRDLKKIKVDKYVNEYMWARGIKNPPHKVKVKAIKESTGIVKVELVDFPDKLKFKKIREERKETKALEAVEKKKTIIQKAKETKQTPSTTPVSTPTSPEEQKSDEEKKVEEDKKVAEKAKAGEEITKQLEKTQAKQIKHQVNTKTQQSKRPQRKSLAK